MEKYTRIIRNYSGINFRYIKGKVDIFSSKQFHHYYEIYFLINGDIEFLNDHARTKIKPHTVVIIPPGEYHRFIVPEGESDTYERCVLNIYPEFLGGTVLEEALRDKNLLTLTPHDRLAENFLYLKNTISKSSEKDFSYILPAVATDIIFLIKQASNSPETAPNNLLLPIPSRIMDYINKNYKSNITLNDVAKHFFLSVSSVSHIFKDEFGVSIKKYIIEKRMNEIHICLQNGKKPQEASNEFGFSNYSTFYRSYREHFGVSPSHTSKKQ